MKTEVPMYKSIAIDIAQRIINAEFPEGEKMSGRSLLAGHYNVSPETVRRAVLMLREEKVVEVSQGKEILVLSSQNAHQFIERYKSLESIEFLQQKAEELFAHKRGLDQAIEEIMRDIINYSDRLRNLTPYNPMEVEIPQESHVLGRTVQELYFWQHTGATIVAIRRDKNLLISPGPDAVIHPLDRIVIVGDGDVVERTKHFLATYLPEL